MLNFGLIGCGRIAKRHSELLGTGRISGARLVAACDIDEAKARALAENFSIPHYTDMHKMMQSENIDVAVVLTESGNHAKHAVALAAYGKHIIVEKPMALTHSRVASSTLSLVFEDVRRWITSALYNPLMVSAKALS